MKRLFSLFSFLCILSLSGDVFAQKAKVQETVDLIKNHALHPHYVLVSAHRGYWANYPENTLDAYQMAINLGADIIEMDVRMTEDNRMVIFHDACLDRMTTGYGRLREADWNYINSLYLKNEDGSASKYKLLTLDEALTYLKDKAVIAIDIKEGGRLGRSMMIDILKVLKEKGMLYQSIVKGKIPLSDLQTILAKADVTLDSFIYTPIAFSNTPDLAQYLTDYINTRKIYAIELVYKQTKDPILSYIEMLEDAHIWIGNYSFWPETGDGVIAEKIPLTDTDPIIRRYNFQDKDPNDFLDDGRGNWDWLFGLGANYVITDRSELLIEYLTKQGRRTK